MTVDQKLKDLKAFIGGFEKAAVAFSGGVDSSFLLKVVFDVLGEDSLAITVDSLFIPREEISQAAELIRIVGAPYEIIRVVSFDKVVLGNSPERCYHCKRSVFGLLLDTAAAHGIDVLFDGSNLDDLDDFRPGMKALKELGVRSPLLECGFSKSDIREASRMLGLPTWDKPSLACLASRIPYYTKITPTALSYVEQAEQILRKKGFKQLRVRCHGELARIEVGPEERKRFFDDRVLDEIHNALKKIGFRYVTLDLEGYRTGKLNPV